MIMSLLCFCVCRLFNIWQNNTRDQLDKTYLIVETTEEREREREREISERDRETLSISSPSIDNRPVPGKCVHTPFGCFYHDAAAAASCLYMKARPTHKNKLAAVNNDY